jgi:hypothetical protein
METANSTLIQQWIQLSIQQPIQQLYQQSIQQSVQTMSSAINSNSQFNMKSITLTEYLFHAIRPIIILNY